MNVKRKWATLFSLYFPLLRHSVSKHEIVQMPYNKVSICNTLPNYPLRRKVHLSLYWLFERQTINLDGPSSSPLLRPASKHEIVQRPSRNKVSIYNALIKPLDHHGNSHRVFTPLYIPRRYLHYPRNYLKSANSPLTIAQDGFRRNFGILRKLGCNIP